MSRLLPPWGNGSYVNVRDITRALRAARAAHPSVRCLGWTKLSPAVPNWREASQRSVAARRCDNCTAVLPTAQPSLSQHDAERWLSHARLGAYLAHAGGYLGVALELYVWNGALAAAALNDTCHLEVALRNAYDAQMVVPFPDWAIDSASGLFARTQGVQRAAAKQHALNAGSVKGLAEARRGAGPSGTHGQVVAALSFGFWTKLTERDRTPTFWTPMLHRAFPTGTSRADVHDLAVKVNRFRNRLAHNEPVFSTRTGLHDRLVDVDNLFTLVNPAAAAFIRQRSIVAQVVSQCPVSGIV